MLNKLIRAKEWRNQVKIVKKKRSNMVLLLLGNEFWWSRSFWAVNSICVQMVKNGAKVRTEGRHGTAIGPPKYLQWLDHDSMQMWVQHSPRYRFPQEGPGPPWCQFESLRTADRKGSKGKVVLVQNISF